MTNSIEGNSASLLMPTQASLLFQNPPGKTERTLPELSESQKNEASGLLEPQHILHVVDSWTLADDPLGGAQCAVGKSFATGCLVSQFHALAIGGKDDRVVAHHIATAEGVHADFVAG